MTDTYQMFTEEIYGWFQQSRAMGGAAKRNADSQLSLTPNEDAS